MLPNFFIIGAAKAGTTSLYHYLEDHQEVFMCSVKEPNYFSYDDIIRQNLYYSEKGFGNKEEYEALFKDVTSEKAIGEASVSYLFYEKTPTKIKAVVPDAKIIIILRNPVDRGFSHFLMDKKLGYISLVFEDVIFKRVQHKNIDLYYQQYVELGLYHEQVKRYKDCPDGRHEGRYS
jgi:sulfotransferase family protein